MSSETNNRENQLRHAVSRVGDAIADTTTAAKNAASDLGRSAAATATDVTRGVTATMDANRDAAARELHSAASALHQSADNLPGGAKISDLAHSAADTLHSTGDYVKDLDVRSVLTDLERLVRNNPAQSLFAAATIGFLVGRAVSSD